MEQYLLEMLEDSKKELSILKDNIKECRSSTLEQALKTKKTIDILFEHSDDSTIDRKLNKEFDETIEKFSKNCTCSKKRQDI